MIGLIADYTTKFENWTYRRDPPFLAPAFLDRANKLNIFNQYRTFLELRDISIYRLFTEELETWNWFNFFYLKWDQGHRQKSTRIKRSKVVPFWKRLELFLVLLSDSRQQIETERSGIILSRGFAGWFRLTCSAGSCCCCPFNLGLASKAA